MAKKTDKPIILNNLDEDNIVIKSRPLMLMKEVPFELGELKVLDTYLSRINPFDPTATTVRFSKEEYEDLMGIEQMRPERLNKYVTSLQGKTIKVPDTTSRNGWRNYNLFDESAFEQDENDQWWIDLCCTPKAKKLIFNVEGIGYIRYQLKNVLPLKSKYSVLLYVYLLDNRFRKSWTISVKKLREEIFRCNSEFYTKQFKHFKQDILEKAIKEVNKLTDLTFSYETVKVGRTVTDIKFNLVKDNTAIPENTELEGQLSLGEKSFDFDDDYDLVTNAKESLKDFVPELNDAQVDELFSLSYDHVDADRDNIIPRENRIVDYIMAQVKYTNVHKPKKSWYKYLRGAVQENYAEWKNQ